MGQLVLQGREERERGAGQLPILLFSLLVPSVVAEMMHSVECGEIQNISDKTKQNRW